MMGFAETQTKLLAGKLDRRHVRTRELGERTVSYIEGWHAIVEANRIFGFEGWDRETIWSQCVWEEGRREPKACAYAVRVRIRVRAGDVIVCREGSGVGHGSGGTLGEAHESALKEAETDAMKRALMTFGNLFGLALYDKDQRGVRGKVSPDPEGPRLVWTVLSADGHALATCGDPKSFCSRLRQAIGACSDGAFLRRLWTNNAGLVEALRACRPDLTTKKGEHFTNVLERVFEAQLAKLTAGSPVSETEMPSIDKAALAIGVPRRLRDRSTSRGWQHSRASSAAGRLARRTISASRSFGRSGARSATNGRCPSAICTIERCMRLGTRRPGGRNRASTHE